MNNPVREPLQSDESNLLPSNAFGSGEFFSAQCNEMK